MRVLVGSGFRRFRREPHSRPPKEYQQHFQEWLRSQPSDVQRKFEGVDLFKDVVLELLENMSRIYTVDAQPVAITGKSSSR